MYAIDISHMTYGIAHASEFITQQLSIKHILMYVTLCYIEQYIYTYIIMKLLHSPKKPKRT